MYPEYIEIDGKEYKINTDYRIALACFRAINDTKISDCERATAVCTLLLGEDFPFELMTKALPKCAIYLRCGEKENTSSGEIDMDYEKDQKYIIPSFQSCYGIDITNQKEEMHWWKYNDYIGGFGEKEVLTRVRDIRNTKVEDIKDSKTRDRVREVKKMFELETKEVMSDKERKAHEKFNELMGFNEKEGEEDE